MAVVIDLLRARRNTRYDISEPHSPKCRERPTAVVPLSITAGRDGESAFRSSIKSWSGLNLSVTVDISAIWDFSTVMISGCTTPHWGKSIDKP